MAGRERLIALIPAAGGGRRYGEALPKQYADLAGAPLLARTMERLASALPLAAMVVALAPNDGHFDALVAVREGVATLRCGGPSRAQTVANALAQMAASWRDDDWILVHDAARPCVPADTLRRLVDELEGEAVGGLLAISVADTLKRDDAAMPPRVLRTEARAGLWQAQTPQMFRLGVLRRALAAPAALMATDEAQAVEALAATGACAPPRLVAGSAQNVKVTYPGDLALAAAVLHLQREAST